MAIWTVRATWIEDETEACEQWEVHASTAHEAVMTATKRVRFPPHHVEARLRASEDEDLASGDLKPGQSRHVPAS